MRPGSVPPSVTTAALLKSQLDQGKDYFDLLVPFVRRGVLELATEVIDPLALRRGIQERFGLDIPLRTLTALLDRLSRRDGSGVQKDGGAYLRTAVFPADDGSAPLLVAFRQLGEIFAYYCVGRLASVTDSDSALDILCGFLETHSATLVLDDPLPPTKTGRHEDIVVASFLASSLQAEDPNGETLTALLQGLVLARAVTLTDLAEVERRLSGLVVYFDTPFVLALAGLCGPPDQEAARDSVRLLSDLGATAAVFDATIAEVRRILGVYEDKLDSASGRQSLYRTPLTAYFFSINATGADVRARSALLESTVRREGMTIHMTPRRQREFVGDEAALTRALKDVRGEGYEARELHDINCVAAILTLRRGRQPRGLEDARAIFAATGMVVRTTRAWWSDTEGQGLPPVLEQSAIINYCWLKRPRTGATLHRFELAALCSAILQPSADTWNRFRTELRKMMEDGSLSSEEASVVLIDSYASKLLVESEEAETIGPGTVADIIQRVREEQQRETEAARSEAVREREARLEAQVEADERHRRELAEREAGFGEQLSAVVEQLQYERTRSEGLETSIAGIARILAWALTVPVLGAVVVAVAVVAIFPVIGSSSLPAAMRATLQVLTVLLGFAGGAFGLSALSIGRPLQGWIERRIRSRLLSLSPRNEAAVSALSREP